MVRQIDPPDTGDKEVLFDEPGRCGGQDSHCHHYRVAGTGHGVALYCRNGGGDSSIRISNAPAVVAALAAMDSDGRYWMLNAMYHASQYAARDARDAECRRWTQAAVDKRIKVRRKRVEILTPVTTSAASPQSWA
jgi:hypothetical protein